MEGVSLIRIMVGAHGNIFSAFLLLFSALFFLSPVLLFWSIWKKKSTEEFQPQPYLTALMSCMMRIFYGLHFVRPDSTLMLIINAFGFAMEIIYLTIFFIYTNNKYRLCKFLGIITGQTFQLVPRSIAKRSRLIGIICVPFEIIMYGSPLSNVMSVFETKSSKFMPKLLIIFGTLNAATWVTYECLNYACLKALNTFDIFMGHGIGAILGVFQLIVYWWFRNGKKKKLM